MKKIRVFLLAIIILLIILLLVYVFAVILNKKNYTQQYEACKAHKFNLEDYVKDDPSSREALVAKICIESNGCFVECGSGCGLSGATLSPSEMFEFYFGSMKACLAVCVPGCLYP